MYISKLSIRNYRNFRNISLKLTKGINTIIGENGSGKTNLLQGIRILIDSSLPRSIRFYETDFNRSIGSWKGHWIILQIEFDDLDLGDEFQALVVHRTGEIEEDSKKGCYSLFFRPKKEIREKLYQYSCIDDKDQNGLNEILNQISVFDYEIIFNGRTSVDFSDDSIYNDYVGDFDEISFPDPEELQEDIYGSSIKTFSITNELACTYIQALRDVENDMRSFKDNPLLNLLRNREKNIDIAQKDNIESKIQTLNDEISELDEIVELSSGISNSVRATVGETYAPNIEIKSELPADMERLMKSLRLWVGDPDEIGYVGHLSELSLGGINILYLALKLLEYEKVKSPDKIANFLLIEEPEAHIHTHIQKSLFNKLPSNNTQVIVTTHSTHISSVSKISSMHILSRMNGTCNVFNPSNNLESHQIVALERYLDAVRTNLLFAKSVILVEGDAEQILIPTLVKEVFGVTLDELGISLINIGSTGFENVASIFHDDRIKRKCAIITDLDASIIDLPKDEKDDNNEQKSCRASQKSGEQRKLRLDEFIKNNDWLNVFYAGYTFEVDFIKSNNSHEVKQLVSKEFSRDADIKRIHGLLDDKSVAIAGKEILRLAEKYGKGWFAIKLSEYITHLTSVPTYILEALAFVSEHLNQNVHIQIMEHRLNSHKKSTFEGNTTDFNMLHDNINELDSISSKLEHYKENLSNDVFTEFLALVE